MPRQYTGTEKSIDLIERCTMIFLRTFAFISVLVAWSAMVESMLDGYAMAFVLLVDALVLTLFEIAMPILASLSREAPLFRNEFLQHVIFMNDFMKAVIYVVLAILSCLQPHEVWPALITGLCLLVMSILRFTCVLLERQRRSLHRYMAHNEQTLAETNEYADDLHQSTAGAVENGRRTGSGDFVVDRDSVEIS